MLKYRARRPWRRSERVFLPDAAVGAGRGSHVLLPAAKREAAARGAPPNPAPPPHSEGEGGAVKMRECASGRGPGAGSFHREGKRGALTTAAAFLSQARKAFNIPGLAYAEQWLA